VWTPRRILLLVAGAGICIAAFLLYNRFLGWIDGLPMLPERFLAAAKPDQPPVEDRRETRLVQMLRQAFGNSCAEADYAYKLRLQAQGLAVAFRTYTFPHDDTVILEPFSVASFGKVNADTNYPEINTVHCTRARIKFDRPVETLADLGHSKLVAADFFSDPDAKPDDPRDDSRAYIHVIHNHSSERANNLHVKCRGPLHFEDNAASAANKPQLWTDNGIEVVDYQTSPAHVIKADLFRLFLESDALRTGEKRAANRTSSVRRIELERVQMLLTIDKSSDPFAASSVPQPKAEATSQLSIRTQGTFWFNIPEHYAEFLAGETTTKLLPQSVEVFRDQSKGADELRCDRLQLQFKPKDASTVNQKQLTEPRDSSGPLSIQEVTATGPNVVLLSAEQQLNACGTKLIFRQDKREAVLFGSPMSAVHKGHLIKAPELFLHRPDPNLPPTAQTIRLARASGPGMMYLHDDKDKEVEVRWRDELLVEREGTRDRVTLTGAAAFQDRDTGEWLHGDSIRIWMVPAPPNAKDPQGKPERLRVAGRVEARMRDMIIEDTPLLDVWFEDAEPAPPAIGTLVAPQVVSPVAARSTAPPSTPPQPDQPSKKPVHMSAEYIEAFIRGKDLDRAACRRRVHVRQDSADPNVRGLDVRCETLDLKHYPSDLNTLTLNGGAHTLARVEVPELTLEGPQIVFDQRDNRVDVNGAGLAVMRSNSNLAGEKTTEPSNIVIRWSGKMDLIGNRISFHGGVHAEQATIHQRELQTEKELNQVLAPRMDIYLDRAVKLDPRQRERSAASQDDPRMKRVVCHHGDGNDPIGAVTIAGNLWRNGKRIRYQQIDAPEVTFENDTHVVTATCGENTRGELRLFQLGNVESPTDVSAKPAPNAASEQRYTLTHVEFRKQMQGNPQGIKFSGSVRAWHAPTDDPNLRMNVDHLPKDAFTLTAQSLEVAQNTDALGKHYTTMLATGKADVYAPDFSGLADVIKYDESKHQQVIFESSDSNPAALYHIKEKGKPPMQLLGKTIIYYRETNDFRGSGLVGATGAGR
jgi:hypothetical protein